LVWGPPYSRLHFGAEIVLSTSKEYPKPRRKKLIKTVIVEIVKKCLSAKLFVPQTENLVAKKWNSTQRSRGVVQSGKKFVYRNRNKGGRNY